MAQKIAFVNNKGGSAKTTTTVNLAGALHVKFPSKKILIFESDGQGNATRSFGLNPNDIKYSAEDVFLGDKKAEEVIQKDVAPNIDLIAGNDDLNFLEFDKMQEAEDALDEMTEDVVSVLLESFKNQISSHREVTLKDIYRMADNTFSEKNVSKLVTNSQYSPSKNYFNMLSGKIDKIDKEYDYIFFDTPPEIKAVTSSVLAVANKVIIPYEPDTYSIDGIKNIIKRIQKVKSEYNDGLEIGGLLATKYRSSTTVHQSTVLMVTDLANTIGIPFFSTRIPHTVEFIKSVTLHRKPATLGYESAGSRKKRFINSIKQDRHLLYYNICGLFVVVLWVFLISLFSESLSHSSFYLPSLSLLFICFFFFFFSDR